jgi:hypothetical protein
MSITIRDLSYRLKTSRDNTPYLIVNCVFQCEPGYYHAKAMARSQEYREVVVTGSPEEEKAEWDARLAEEERDEEGAWLEKWVEKANNLEFKKVWTYDDPIFTYIEKFDVFWFREWVATCPITRSALQELRDYQTSGKISSIYRTTDEEIVLKHLETIRSYWD